jgi:hypothetical protein
MHCIPFKKTIVGLATFLSLAVMTALVGVTPQAEAAASNSVPTPAAAAATVANATTAAQQAAGRVVSGDPANTPTVSTTATGAVTAASPDGTTLSIGLPSAPKTKASAKVKGASVLGVTADQTIPVVNPTPGGLQVAQDILGASAPTSYSYKLTLPTGYKPVLQKTGVDVGSIALTSAKGKTALSADNTLGFIDPAWAEDANGNSVNTSYSVSGTTVTQTVDTAGVTAWPVVADPHISFGWVIYVHWYHAEVGNIYVQAWIAGLGVATAMACSGLSVGFLVPVCAFLIAAATAFILGLFLTAWNRGGGIVWKFAYVGTPLGYMYVGDNWT